MYKSNHGLWLRAVRLHNPLLASSSLRLKYRHNQACKNTVYMQYVFERIDTVSKSYLVN